MHLSTRLPERAGAAVGFFGAALAALGTTFSPAAAGEIHPGLVAQLSRLGSEETASAILVLSEQAPIAEISAALTARAATRQERHYEVVTALQATAATTQAPLLAELDELRRNGEIVDFTPYWIANLVVVEGRRRTIEALALRDDVAVAEVNFRAELVAPAIEVDPDGGSEQHRGGIGVTPGVRGINADRVWYELGITGAGTLQGGCDTGVDGNHPALASRWRGTHAPWQECWLDVLGSSQFPNGNAGSHGTHVMGTQCGLGAATGDSIGVAPGSEWIATNVIGQGVGNEFDNDVIASYQWFADPDGDPFTVEDVPDVVQNSWRINEFFGGSYTDCDTRWWAAMDNVEASGTVLTFSAGNEGPGGTTIGSPADRAATPLNAFSVGAVDATNFNYPFPIASFSSRGPSGCAGNPIKPEISAPGVDVYSSVPGGGYQQSGWSGTSMAGPHVAGVVALMREADPNLEVDVIKQVLIETARDAGAAGEDNAYGWGIIDAYEAVVQVAAGLGQLEGFVRNDTNGGTAIASATIEVVEASRSFQSDGSGHYNGFAPNGTVTIEASHPSFATVTVPGVVLVEGELTNLDFDLVDILAPAISDVTYLPYQDDDGVAVTGRISDWSALDDARIVYRVNGGPWLDTPLSPVSGEFYTGTIPAQTIGAVVEFYLAATDLGANVGTEPDNAPVDVFSYFASALFVAEDGEDGTGWSLTSSGDTAVGRWVRVDPFGTTWNSNQVEPADDHSADPGVRCFVTGQGVSGGSAGSSDVDGGCVTLTSPNIDLSDATEATMSYWRWYAQFGASDANFTTQVSSNGGASWTTIETLTANANSWQNLSFDLGTLVSFTSNFRVRFIACDTLAETLVEAAIDDFVISGVDTDPADVETEVTPLRTQLLPNRPNPFREGTVVRYQLATSGPVRLEVFDAAGRQVRTLVAGSQNAGTHAIDWDGRNDGGALVPAGLYLYRLETEGLTSERKMLRVR